MAASRVFVNGWCVYVCVCVCVVVVVVVNQAEKVLWCYSCTFSRAISLSLHLIETSWSVVHSVYKL